MANGVRASKKREAQVQYLQQHGKTLERVAQHCINQVLKERPSDPYAALLDRFSEHTKAGVRFDEVKCYATAAGEVICELRALARGSCMSIQRQAFDKELLLAGLRAAGAPDLETDADAGVLAVALGSRIRSVVKEVSILDLVKMDKALSEALPAPPKSESESESGEEAAIAAVAALRLALLDFLLAASGRLLGDGTLAAVRAILAACSLPVAAPLHCRSDLRPWARLWPRLLLPATEGPGPALFVGTTVWAARLPEVAVLSSSMPARYADEIARLSRQLDAMREDGIELTDEEMHQDDEFCPVLNSAQLAAKLAWEVAAAWGSTGVGGDSEEKLAASLTEFGNAVKQVAPSLGHPAPSTLEDELFKSSVFCALDLQGPSLYNEEDGCYHLPGEDAARTSDEMLQLVAKLCAAAPTSGAPGALQALLRPLSESDPNYSEGMAKLRDTLPEGIAVLEASALQDPSLGLPSFVTQGLAAKEASSGASIASTDPANAAAEALGDEQEQLDSSAALAYDFREPQETFLSVGISSLLALLLTAPAAPTSRMLILPKKEKPEELLASVSSLDSALGGILATTYARERPTDKRGQGRRLVEAQFRTALKELKWSDATKCSKALFDFLDWRKDGAICETDLAILSEISGPASPQKVDSFRIWLCQAARALEDLRASRGVSLSEGPMHLLVRKMDPGGSGFVTYHDFYRALKCLKHPDATSKHAGAILELFSALDLSKSGRISIEDFFCLTVLSSRHQLNRVSFVRTFFERQFGSYKAAWKALDEESQGQLEASHWVSLMQSQGYQDLEDLETCAQFIDRDGSKMLSIKEFELLGTFSVANVVADLEKLRSHWEEAHNRSLEDAFAALLAEAAAPSLSAEAFCQAVRSTGLQLSAPGRLLFNSLDAMRRGELTLEDFLMLRHQQHVQALAEASESLKGPTASLRRFLSWWSSPKVANVEGSEAERWKRLHQEMLSVTANEIY